MHITIVKSQVIQEIPCGIEEIQGKSNYIFGGQKRDSFTS
jgi:hypothetical protein